MQTCENGGCLFLPLSARGPDAHPVGGGLTGRGVLTSR